MTHYEDAVNAVNAVNALNNDLTDTEQSPKAVAVWKAASVR
jgi:hypothetical protein